MAEGYFTEAASLMREGGLDPREVHSVVSIRLFAVCLPYWDQE